MKKKKALLVMSLSIFIICFLLNNSFLNVLNTKALVEEEYIQYNNDSLDSYPRKWGTAEIVSTESTSDSYDSSFVVDSEGNIHITWRDSTNYAGAGVDWDIFYKRWDASTFLWTTTEVVSTESTSASYDPSLAVDTLGNIHIAWEDATDYAGSGTDRDIFYKRWDSVSSSWTTTEVVSTESTIMAGDPSLATDFVGNIHIAWEDSTNYAGSGNDQDIFYKRWNSSTSTWTTTEIVSTESTLHSPNPSLDTDSAGNVHIAWYDDTNYAGSGADTDIFYKKWNASSSIWTTTEVVSTESTADSYHPSLDTDSAGNVHIAWYDYTSYVGSGADEDIFYKQWNASISTWTVTEVVSTESTSSSYFPSLAVDTARNVHIAWHDYTDYDGKGSDIDIFYKRRNSSSSWIITEVVSTESTDASYTCSLAIDLDGDIHISWGDSTNYAGAGTDQDIFYKRTIVPPTAPELAFIVPNPTELETINLDWNDVIWATNYHVYRSNTYIWSIESLIPIDTVSSSEYGDTLPSEGYYYYVIVAGNAAGNSTHSNCQYVEMKAPELKAPELSFVLPNPTDIDSVSLIWDSVDGATEYYVYRSDTYIWSVEGLNPIATEISTTFVDTLPDEGFYFYVIVATDGSENSTHSNCEYIQYKLPVLSEFAIVSGLILGTFVCLFVIVRTRKKKSKLN